MANRRTARKWLWLLAVTAAATVSALSLHARPIVAGELDKLETSLKIVPADAAFYCSMLRCGEQVETIAKSKAWAKMTSMPVVQMGLMLYQVQAGDPQSVLGQIQAALKDPEARKGLDLLGDMTSQEIFVFGDSSVIDCLELVQRLMNWYRSMTFTLNLPGGTDDPDADLTSKYAPALLDALLKNRDAIQFPNVVVGFKVKNVEAAKKQLSKLENQLAFKVGDQPEVLWKRTEIAGHQYLTSSLDGQMIPWEQLPVESLARFETNKGDVKKLIAQFKKLKLVVAIGLREDYVLLSLGSSTKALAALGKGKLLADRPELKPLERFAGKRLSSISYLSEPMASRLSSTKKDIDDLRELVDGILKSSELNAAQQDRIRKDAAALAEDIKRFVPKAGAMMAFSFLIEHGIEAYQYDWSEQLGLDGSKPLGLLRHLGGEPTAAVVCRGKITLGDYDLLVKWLKVGYGYFEEFAVPQMPAAEREKYEQFAKLAAPLLERLDRANREMLLPALDGQMALVADTKLKSDNFVAALPTTPKPMPMIEPAIIVGVSKPALLSKAFAEYRTLLNGWLDAINQVQPGSVPEEVRIPPPRVAKTKGGTIYGYTLPAEWGLDDQIMPNFGLSENVGLWTISRKHTERLLADTPLKVGGVLSATDRPLAVAGMLDWAGLVDAAAPWVDLVLQQIPGNESGGNNAAVVEQVHTVLEVLKVIRTCTSESYSEQDALVSHSLVEIRDMGDR